MRRLQSQSDRLWASAVSAARAFGQALRKSWALTKVFAESTVRAAKWVSLQVARLLLFVPLILWRGLALILLTLAIIAPIILPISMLGALMDPPGILKSLKESDELPVQAISFVLALGILGNLFMRVLDHGWNELKGILYRASKALRDGPWKPSWRIGESVRTTRQRVLAKIRPNFKCSVKSSGRLMVWLAAGMLLAGIAYPPADPAPKHHVVVANVAEADEVVVKEVVRVYMRAGAVFSLAHAQNAEPKTGAGICLNDEQQRWLEMYRAAIVECLKLEKRHGIERTRPPVFRVTAFASIAPASSSGVADEETSAKTNCLIANHRADAVGALLGGGDDKRWLCGDDGVAAEIEGTDEFCKGEDILYPPEGDDSLEFKIVVNQWGDPQSMIENRPVDDGKVPEDRRYRIEMFNRSVYIAVEEDFCRVGSSLAWDGRPARVIQVQRSSPADHSRPRDGSTVEVAHHLWYTSIFT